jgi:hypothetical protein
VYVHRADRIARQTIDRAVEQHAERVICESLLQFLVVQRSDFDNHRAATARIEDGVWYAGSVTGRQTKRVIPRKLAQNKEFPFGGKSGMPAAV